MELQALERITKDLDSGIVNLNDIKQLIREHRGMMEKLTIMATEVETTKHLLFHESKSPHRLVLEIRRKSVQPWVHVVTPEDYTDEDEFGL